MRFCFVNRSLNFGKNPIIVANDADLALAVPAILYASLATVVKNAVQVRES
jgi:hypothetical protein